MKISIKTVLKVLGCILGSFIILITLILFFDRPLSNYGDRAVGNENQTTGARCDYGFNIYNQTCCDEDDYSCEVCTKNYNGCNDFFDQKEAQSIYNECLNYNPTNNDIYNLDVDNDGVACENLLVE